MPVIREYRSQVRAPGPGENFRVSPDQLGAQEGRALEGLGNVVQGVAQTVAKRIEQENTGDITAKVTKANADLAIDLQQTIRTAEPGDNEAFDNYNKRVEDTLGKIGEDASTPAARQFHLEASERIKGQLFKTSAQGQADLAGVKAVNDYTSTINSLSSALIADPSSLELQKSLHSSAIDNLVNSGQLPKSDALKLKTDGEKSLAKSTIRGWAELNPDYAKEKLKSGEFDKDLGADLKVQLFGEIDQAVRAKEIEQERRLKEQERVAKVQQQQTQNNFLVSLVDKKLTTKEVLSSNLDAFGSGSKEQFIQMLKTANSSESRLQTDGGTMISLFRRIHLPDGDPKKLVDENDLNGFFGNGLSMVDLNRLRDEMQGKQTDAGRIESTLKKQVLDIAEGQLTKSNPLTGFRDPVGDEQMQRFMVYFLEEYKARRAKGESATELLSPDSPNYLGRNIRAYVRTPQQIMRDLAPKRTQRDGLALTPVAPTSGANAPKENQRKPGESPQDYLKRIKGGQ